ncbi:hypothetical protein C8D88_114203 [Lentzea atacamensis]|uniref:Uncharacterized protein n=2 Tax=Lentzea TaxID=165301 RepID=A0A316HP22_9PSEU|nr:hypothetical protein [Lentzea atacamensis]PWK82332.1 hypothetical protein C8D88_114203 [Lentzea atacamensis]
MLSHDQAFAIAKMRQGELEADAAVRLLAKKPEEVAPKPARRRWRLFARVRPASA